MIPINSNPNTGTARILILSSSWIIMMSTIIGIFPNKIEGFTPSFNKYMTTTTKNNAKSSNNCKDTFKPLPILLGNNDQTSFVGYRDSRNLMIQLDAKFADDDDDDEEDDDDDIDLSDRDWRAFRAQLVTSSSPSKVNTKEPSQSEQSNENDEQTSTQNDNTNNNVITDENDLDGIGSLFNDLQTQTSSSQQQQPMSTENFTPLNPSQWAYDSGNVIEQGAVILGGVEQDYGFGLRQQYFHKAVILVLQHDERFTKGIILNRPSDLILVDEKSTASSDDVNNIMDENSNHVEMRWRVWFGGDVQGLDTLMPEVICVHSMPSGNERIDEVSQTVMKDIKWTTFEDAKKLVREGHAKTIDFWVFAGYAGWGPQQLMGELERKSWYMCATDSQTLLKELAKQSALTDPRDAGLDTWELLMNMIGRGETAEESSGDFEDMMLKEWARENLLSIEAGGNAGIRFQPSEVASFRSLVKAQPVESFLKRAKTSFGSDKVKVGSLVRASSTDRSPFLLDNQEFHKSIVLVIADDDEVSAGVILNHPSAQGVEMELIDKVTADRRQLKVPIRFGGQYVIRGQKILMWMHNSQDLKDEDVGAPVGEDESGIWRCSQDQATQAIQEGIARPSDFIITTGLSIWMKGSAGDGIQGEVRDGNFEMIPEAKFSSVWKKLQSQKETLTKINLIKNISDGHEAWEAGAPIDAKSRTDDEEDDVVTEGIGEGFDEDNSKYVHNTDTKVSKLSDDALRSWIATHLLGAPTLGA